jgi:hypothetical protein
MMSSEITGQVRARLGGEFQPATNERSGGLVSTADQGDDGWSAPQAETAALASNSNQSADEEELLPSANQPPGADEEVLEWVDDEANNISPVVIETPSIDAGSPQADYPSMLESDVELSSRPVASPIRILKRGGDEAAAHAMRVHETVLEESEEQSVTQREYLDPIDDESIAFEEVDGMNGDLITWKSKTTLVGFLITYDNDKKGDYVELRTGRLMVTSEFESAGNCLVVAHPTVSPMHAIMRVGASGTVQVLDQLSEHGTRVRHVGVEEEEFLSGEKGTLNHGDIVYFGDRAFYVCLITPPSE